jgi:hypothetical protein
MLMSMIIKHLVQAVLMQQLFIALCSQTPAHYTFWPQPRWQTVPTCSWVLLKSEEEEVAMSMKIKNDYKLF